MMPVLIDTETLVQRFILAKQGRSHVTIAALTGMSRNTLDTFAFGKRVSLATLEAIHAWVEDEEAMHGYTVVRKDA